MVRMSACTVFMYGFQYLLPLKLCMHAMSAPIPAKYSGWMFHCSDDKSQKRPYSALRTDCGHYWCNRRERSNITYSTNCNYRISAALYTLETWFVSDNCKYSVYSWLMIIIIDLVIISLFGGAVGIAYYPDQPLYYIYIYIYTYIYTCVCMCVCLCKKVKWSRYRPVVAQRVGRGIVVLFHDRGTRRCEWSAARPGRTLPPGKNRYPFYRRLGGPQGRSRRAENFVPTGIRSRTFQLVVSRYTDWAIRPTCIHKQYFILVSTPTGFDASASSSGGLNQPPSLQLPCTVITRIHSSHRSIDCILPSTTAIIYVNILISWFYWVCKPNDFYNFSTVEG